MKYKSDDWVYFRYERDNEWKHDHGEGEERIGQVISVDNKVGKAHVYVPALCRSMFLTFEEIRPMHTLDYEPLEED